MFGFFTHKKEIADLEEVVRCLKNGVKNRDDEIFDQNKKLQSAGESINKLQKNHHDDENKKTRCIISCPNCGRMYKRFIPLTMKNHIAVNWCRKCDIALCRFDRGVNEYDESDFK